MIYEAIEAAGGATGEADLENINMVYKLEENVMLNILSKDKVLERSKGHGGSTEENTAGAGPGIQLISDDGDAVIYTGGTTGEKSSSKDSWKKVNINTASIAELDTLPGIGEITAESIIKYRQQHGRFEKIEDIMNVPGIKEGKFEKIKGFITTD
ncbi:MAG: helix-hairpin-helix domain-containing protein [Clostridiaceae bacterium]|nr:helix-hairpin-helix domain-containing protein [Clostridiaceae bacterium]